MSSLTSRLAGAGLGALLAIGIGGAGLAYAQTAEETPSTTEDPAVVTPAPATPDSDAPATGDPDCPEKGGGGGGQGRSPATGDAAGPDVL